MGLMTVLAAPAELVLGYAALDLVVLVQPGYPWTADIDAGPGETWSAPPALVFGPAPGVMHAAVLSTSPEGAHRATWSLTGAEVAAVLALPTAAVDLLDAGRLLARGRVQLDRAPTAADVP